MNRGDLIKAIQIELEELNKKIDLKVIKGRSYKKESKRHKFLISQLTYLMQLDDAARLAKSIRPVMPKINWLTRTARTVSAFIF